MFIFCSVQLFSLSFSLSSRLTILIESHEHNLQMDVSIVKTTGGNKSDLEPKTENVNIDGQIARFCLLSRLFPFCIRYTINCNAQAFESEEKERETERERNLVFGQSIENQI